MPGVTCSLFIWLLVKDELSVDGFHPRGVAWVMVHSVEKDGTISGSGSYTQGLLAEALKRKVPEVAYAATVVWENEMVFTVGKEVRKEKGRYVGNDFLRGWNKAF